MSPTPVANAGESARISADVFAAGAVLWRDFTGQLEVLLIHRPKHKDWSCLLYTSDAADDIALV